MDGQSLYRDWYNARENAREAIEDVRKEGIALAEAEARYYRAKSIAYAELLEKVPATAAAAMVKGDERVNQALMGYRAAQGIYKAACNAAQLFTNEEAHCYDSYKRAMAGDREVY